MGWLPHYARHSGWWNQDGNFTIEKFLGMMLMYEMGGTPGSTDYIIQAVSLHLWGDARSDGGLGPFCTGSCIYGVFNFLAMYAQSAQKRYDIYIRHVDPESGDPSNKEPTLDYPVMPGVTQSTWNKKDFMAWFGGASNIGYEILNPTLDNTIYTGDKAYHWGNYEKVGDNPSKYHYLDFFVFSADQLTIVQKNGGQLKQVK